MLRNVQRAALLRETVGVVDSPNMVAQPCFLAGGRSLSIRQASAPSLSAENRFEREPCALGSGCGGQGVQAVGNVSLLSRACAPV